MASGYVKIELSEFNKHGLEMNRINTSQSITTESLYEINSFQKLLGMAGRTTQFGARKTVIIDRNDDLTTEKQQIFETNSARVLGGDKYKLTEKDKNELVLDKGQCIETGKMSCLPTEYNKNYLQEYTEKNLEEYGKPTQDEIEKMTDVERYKLLTENSSEFKNTLLETSKTNDELKKVVEQLGLDKEEKAKNADTVSIADFEEIYQKTDCKDTNKVMKNMLEETQEKDNNRDADEIEQ